MLREFVASIPDNGYKRCYSSSLFSVSLPSLSSLALLLNIPLIRLELTDEMKSPTKTRSTTKPKEKASSDMYSIPLTPSPSASSSTSHTRPFSNALRNVRRLPRKASRLVCIADKIDARADPTHRDHGKTSNKISGNGESHANGGACVREGMKGFIAEEQSSSDRSSGQGSASTRYTTNASSSASSAPGIVVPILSPSELAKALEKQLLVSQPPIASQSSDVAPGRDSLNVSGKLRGRRSDLHLAAPVPIPVIDEDPVPRPLSPPPDHFRRRDRVLSGPGPGLGPYTTPSPVNSPPTSPHANQLRLHDLLSNESLVVQPLTLYNGAADSDSDNDDDDCRSIKSDIGSNARAFSQRAGHPISSSVLTRDRASTFFQIGHHSRTHSRIPQRQSEHDALALRRVFSR